MRINPINAAFNKHDYAANINNKAFLSNTAEKSSSAAIDSFEHRIAFKKKPAINDVISNAPFEDKLAVGLKKLALSTGAGNFMIVANNLKELPKLIKYVQTPFFPIRKLILMIDKKIKDSMIFARNYDSITLLNSSKVPFITPMMDYLATDETIDINIGDRFRNSQGWFEIKETPDNPLLQKNSSMFIKTLDYNEKLNKFNIKHNQEILNTIEELNKPASKSKKLTFDSIGGQDKVIDALKKNILFPLKYPEVFEDFMMSRGTILYGPPGTGKTLLAKTLAAESGASIFELCGTELANKYVGQSEENCRELFQKAVDAQPSIIYFDEIEALGKKRGEDKYGDKLLTQFLSCMSDLEKRGDLVFIVGSTNRKEDLDAAFIRSGRFSNLLEVKAPDLEGTKQILTIHTNNKPIDKNVDLDLIALKMHAKNMTGADIAAIIKDAFSNALERTGIYKSMEENRFSSAMKDYLTITNEDILTAINVFKQDSNSRKPIGYNK